MLFRSISGLPVVNKEGCPLGIVSEFDHLELICDGHTEADTVSHFMSPGLYCVAEEDSWVHVADMFREKHVRRLPVLRDGNLVGIVTRHDLLHAIRDARQRIRQKLDQHGCQTSRQEQAERVPVVESRGDSA